MTYPTVLSAADEEAVHAFLTGRLPFIEIAGVVSAVLDAHEPVAVTSLDVITECDRWARSAATEIIAGRN